MEEALPKLHVVDVVMMIIYFIVLLGIGYRIMMSKKKKSESESFLAADRDMGLTRTAASASATDLGGGFTIAMGGLGFTMGLAGHWIITTSAISAIVVAWLMVPKIKRVVDKIQGITTGDIFEQRFDSKTGLVAAIVIGLSWFAFVGGQVIAGSRLVTTTTGLDLNTALLVSGAVILAYATMGGLKAVIYTDVFQMAILLVGVIFLMVPIGWVAVGGWDGMATHFAADPETADFMGFFAVDWVTGLGWFLSVFPVWFISIATLQRVIAAKDPETAQKGIFLTGIPIEFPLFAIGTTLIGMYARILMPELLDIDPELALPSMMMEYLPIGIGGFVLAAYVAAVMSTADSCLMGPVAVVTRDIYQKRIKPDATDQELTKLARIMTLVLGVLAIWLAYSVETVLEAILYAYTFGAAGLFFPMLGLLFWKGTTTTGAFASIIGGGGIAIIWVLAGNPNDIPESYLGWGVSFVLLVVVSLLTKHSPGEDIDSFFPKKQ
ncbi:MAG: sodium:solute symporter family protein [Bacillota bacterium]